jgi:hypothetical protein
MRDPSGVVVKDPDMAVQERLALVFEMFLKFRTVAKVMRLLNERGLDLPRRDRHGDLCWTRATICSVAAILKNPAYAGAFVYGRTRMRTLARWCITGESAATNRGMANCREGSVSCLRRLADL